MLMGHRVYKRLNIFLLLAIFLVNGYVIMLPLLPGIQFWWDHRHGNNTPQKLSSQLQTAAQSQKEGDTPKPPTNPDSPQPTGFVADAAHDGLVIPRLSLQVPVVTGSVDQSLRWLAKGTWLTPAASTPDKDSNTVIAGHRFTYTQPRGPFYFLNQLQEGDIIGLWWHGKLYTYTTERQFVVSPNDTSILAPTDNAQLTLYTCTPLWKPDHRLVITAKLKEGPSIL
jgi:LPXTG-site transpeptidase (sortase) family protein